MVLSHKNNYSEIIDETLLMRGSQLPSRHLDERLAGALPDLNKFLGGGLIIGGVSEWGMPASTAARPLLLDFVAQVNAWTLWVYPQSLNIKTSEYLRIYPPSWAARGVDLQRTRFVTSAEPVRELKPLWMNPFFKLVVLDHPPKLSKADMAFLAQRARLQNQIFVVVRNFWLTPKRGNIWAQQRLNVKRRSDSSSWLLQGLRGTQARDQEVACLF